MNATYGVVAITLVALARIGIGAFGLRISRTTSDFYVASRSVSPALNSSAIGGEYLSAASFLGVAGLVIFFQAEDGIRDGTVTGVQTCALPISRNLPRMLRMVSCAVSGRRSAAGRRSGAGAARDDQLVGMSGIRRLRRVDAAGGGRSEERRVGKECRSRWSAEH